MLLLFTLIPAGIVAYAAIKLVCARNTRTDRDGFRD